MNRRNRRYSKRSQRKARGNPLKKGQKKKFMSRRALHGMYARKAAGKKTKSRVGRLCRRNKWKYMKKQPKTLVSCAKQALGKRMYKRNGLASWVRSLRLARRSLRKAGLIKTHGYCVYPKKGQPQANDSRDTKEQKLLYRTAMDLHKHPNAEKLAQEIEAGKALKGPKGKKWI